MLPEMTKEQRQASLAKAMSMRTKRAEYRKHLKEGSMKLDELFKLSDDGDKAAGGMRVFAVLKSLPGYAERRAQLLMKQRGISSTRKVKGLGKNQRAALLKYVVR